MATTFTTVKSAFGLWDPQFLDAAHDYCGVQHKSIKTAILCQETIQSRCRRENGANTWLDIHLVANDEGTLRKLTEAEEEELENIR